MNGRGGNNFQDSLGARRSSSESSMSLNPEAAAFNCRQPESPRYPVGPSGYGRSGRGRSRAQPGTFPLPPIPPRSGRQIQHQQPPLMIQGACPPFLNPLPFDAGLGYQPMYPVFPPHPTTMGTELHGMPYPPPPTGFERGGYQSFGLEHQGTDQNGTGFTCGPSEAMRRSVASMSGESHSRTESQSSQGGPPVMTEKMIKDKYRAEFEEARGFEDGRIYFPQLFPEDKK
ncbi:hypothetical protein CHU98_g1881 [Xylaria longipes]|nr:hypothetical protein CHU98_g1881 [Xylaria longipes]